MRHHRKIQIIISEVAAEFGTTPHEMISERRGRDVTLPRFVAMALSRDLTSYSLPRIGKCFGGRDHSTVGAAIKRFEELVGKDGSLAARVAELRLRLASLIPAESEQDRLSIMTVAALSDLEQEMVGQLQSLFQRLRREACLNPNSVFRDLQDMPGRLERYNDGAPVLFNTPSTQSNVVRVPFEGIVR